MLAPHQNQAFVVLGMAAPHHLIGAVVNLLQAQIPPTTRNRGLTDFPASGSSAVRLISKPIGCCKIELLKRPLANIRSFSRYFTELPNRRAPLRPQIRSTQLRHAAAGSTTTRCSARCCLTVMPQKLELFSASYRAVKGSLNHAVALLGVMEGGGWATARWRDSSERAPMALRLCLSLLHAFSIGLRSGE